MMGDSSRATGSTAEEEFGFVPDLRPLQPDTPNQEQRQTSSPSSSAYDAIFGNDYTTAHSITVSPVQVPIAPSTVTAVPALQTTLLSQLPSSDYWKISDPLDFVPSRRNLASAAAARPDKSPVEIAPILGSDLGASLAKESGQVASSSSASSSPIVETMSRPQVFTMASDNSISDHYADAHRAIREQAYSVVFPGGDPRTISVITVKKDPTVISSSSSPTSGSQPIPRWPTETSDDVLMQNTVTSILPPDDSEQEDETECHNCGHAGDAGAHTCMVCGTSLREEDDEPQGYPEDAVHLNTASTSSPIGGSTDTSRTELHTERATVNFLENTSQIFTSVKGFSYYGLIVDPGASKGLIGEDTLNEIIH